MKLIHPKGPLEAHPLALIFPPMEESEYQELKKSVADHGLRDDIILLDGKVLDGIHRYRACLDTETKPVFSNFSEAIDGKSPEAFVFDKNFHRRHLSLSQRAAIGAKFLAIEEAAAKERQASTQFKPKESAAAENVVEVNFAPEGSKEGFTMPVSAPAAASGAPAPVSTTSAPAAKPEKPIKGKGGPAAQKIAEKFGTSATMVKLAKRIKKSDEDLFNQVLNGEKTVAEAIAIIDEKEAKEKETGKALKDKQARAQALAAIGDAYGMDSEVYRKAAGKEILKKPSDLIAFSIMKPKDTKSIIPLLGMGWDLEKAKRYLDGKLTLENSLEDFANIATANGNPEKEAFVFVIGNWTFTVAKASE